MQQLQFDPTELEPHDIVAVNGGDNEVWIGMIVSQTAKQSQWKLVYLHSYAQSKIKFYFMEREEIVKTKMVIAKGVQLGIIVTSDNPLVGFQSEFQWS